MDMLFSLSQFIGIPLLLLLASLSIFYYIWMAKVINKNNFKPAAPEVSGAWPIVGHLPQLIAPRPLFRVLGDMADKYGPMFMVRIGMYPTLVVSSCEMAKDCFTTNDRIFASRPASAAGKYLSYDSAMVGFAFYGSYWREIRKISTLELLSHRRLELLKHIPFNEIDASIKQLYKLWMKKNSQSHVMKQVEVNMSKLFMEITLNTVLKLVVGKGLFDNCNDEPEEGRKLRKTIEEFFSLAGVSVASDAIPFLGWLDIDGQKKNMKRVAKEMDIIAESWLQEHRKKRRDGEPGNDDNDFMDVLLSILDDDNDSHFFEYSRETVIKATSLALILAASDTTSITLTWALSLLVNNPKAIRKAQEELDVKVGKDRHVEERDIENLVYLQAIVKETLRMYPAAPLAVPHEATQDCTVGGYHIAAGTRLVVNLWKLQRDPCVWSNPSEFKPERFLSEEGSEGCSVATDMDYKGQHFEYIPFGSGRRMCPGLNFALQILHMTLARLLHAFDLQSPLSSDGGPVIVNMDEGLGLTMSKVIPLEVLLQPRLPLPLYE